MYGNHETVGLSQSFVLTLISENGDSLVQIMRKRPTYFEPSSQNNLLIDANPKILEAGCAGI